MLALRGVSDEDAEVTTHRAGTQWSIVEDKGNYAEVTEWSIVSR